MSILSPLPPSLDPRDTAVAVATVFGIGQLPRVPGTWGSLATLPLGALLLWIGGPWTVAAAAIAVAIIGFWASEQVSERSGDEDPGYIVVDEVAGQLIALAPAALDAASFGLAFLLFRLLDIVKPWPASWADESLKGGAGVMADDLIAGLYAAVIVWGVHAYGFL